MNTHGQAGFERFGLLALLTLFSLLCILFGSTAPEDTVPSASSKPIAVGYRLGAGDMVRISVEQGSHLTMEAQIGSTGWVSHPAFGEVQIGGMTVGAAEAQIAAGWASRAPSHVPRVSIVVIDVVNGAAVTPERGNRLQTGRERAPQSLWSGTLSRSDRKAISRPSVEGPMIGGGSQHRWEHSRRLSSPQERRI